jgi:hypothetical protein
MLPPFFGALLLLGTVVVTGSAVLVALWASRRRPPLRRRALAVGGAMAGIYAVFWILGLVLMRTTVLSPGSELRFCGLDCHLHVSVTGVRPRPGPELGVTVRFASNAVRAPEWPGKLRFRLRDDEGREFAPLNQVPAAPLPAGAESAFELRFPREANPAGAVLIVTWDSGLDYLVPGAGNILVQRRRRLALPGESRSGA